MVAGVGYHDHNWGFWRDVRWQWGQVAAGDLSFIYGRVLPPADVADPDRIPGFLGVLDQHGLVGVATNVQIAEQKPDQSPALAGAPPTITVTARSGALDLTLTFSTDRAVRRLGFVRWQRWHRLVYAAGVLGIVHFVWRVKADLREPLIFGTILAALLGIRLFAAARRRAATAAA